MHVAVVRSDRRDEVAVVLVDCFPVVRTLGPLERNLDRAVDVLDAIGSDDAVLVPLLGMEYQDIVAVIVADSRREVVLVEQFIGSIFVGLDLVFVDRGTLEPGQSFDFVDDLSRKVRVFRGVGTVSVLLVACPVSVDYVWIRHKRAYALERFSPC